MITRKAAAAGDYYPRDEGSLQQTIDKISRPVREDKRTVHGAVVPHSGIFYVGEAQAHVYKSITGSPIFIVIGVNHRGAGERRQPAGGREDVPYAIMTNGRWETPLGTVSIDTELARTIERGTDRLEDEISPFSGDHSIETQLPWIQSQFRETEFVPISIQGDDPEAYREIGLNIREAIEETGRAVCVVASSDLTRYGENFNFVPFSGNPDEVLEGIRELDEAVVEGVLEMDVREMLEAAGETNVCGAGAIATMMYAVMGISRNAEVLHYDTSYPVTESLQSVTSFAGIVIE